MTREQLQHRILRVRNAAPVTPVGTVMALASVTLADQSHDSPATVSVIRDYLNHLETVADVLRDSLALLEDK